VTDLPVMTKVFLAKLGTLSQTSLPTKEELTKLKREWRIFRDALMDSFAYAEDGAAKEYLLREVYTTPEWSRFREIRNLIYRRSSAYAKKNRRAVSKRYKEKAKDPAFLKARADKAKAVYWAKKEAKKGT
jgi:hypothetical protein